MDLPAVRTLLDLLNRGKLQRQLQALGGCDTSRTGQLVV
jgi:hypothetical protein